ncbi:MAG TPA: TerC family protein [Bryobacteraceae bacterium]|jgi:YjbE family integral membrane protein|nr:TerC family protein [Bryobacteraceae bacterium]
MPLSHLITGVFSIVFIDLLLAGDNALVIAMAVRALQPRERRIGTICGAGAAVALRVGLTFVASKLLDIQFLKLAGGLLVLWIAVKVLVDASEPPDSVAVPKKLMQAIWFIVVADLTMSTDNILAIAGASNGHIELIVFGLALSIPFVVLSANLLAGLMDRYPFTIYLGAGILGRVGGDMILTDSFMERTLHPSTLVRYLVEGALAAALIVGGKIYCDRRRCRPS